MFQEKTSAKVSQQNYNIPRSKRRSLVLQNEEPIPMIRINPKTNPGLLHNVPDSVTPSNVFTFINKLLAVWKICRHTNKDSSNWPRFSGLVATLFKKVGSEKTVLTYLPPIPKPISEYSTIIEIYYQSRQLAKQCNMEYVLIVMDVGAAMKAYQVIWNKNCFSSQNVHIKQY